MWPLQFSSVGEISRDAIFCVHQSHFLPSSLPVIILTHFLIKLYLPDEPWPMDTDTATATATSAAVHGAIGMTGWLERNIVIYPRLRIRNSGKPQENLLPLVFFARLGICRFATSFCNHIHFECPPPPPTAAAAGGSEKIIRSQNGKLRGTLLSGGGNWMVAVGSSVKLFLL